MSKAPRFAAYVPFAATTITTDATGGSGVQAVTSLPAGVYAWFGIAPGACDANSATSTVTMRSTSDASGFAPGDVVDIYDLSGDAVLVSGAVVQTVSGATVKLDQAVTTAEFDRMYLQGDLAGNLEARIAAADGTFTQRLTFRPDSTDPTTISYACSPDVDIALDAYTADVLRLATSITAGSSALTGERPVLGAFSPTKTIVDDLPRKRRIGNTYVADDGTFRRLTVARQVRHLLEVRYRGGPRATDWSEIHAWEDLTDLLDQGYRFRLYRDTSTTTAPYARKTNPYGYQEWYVEDGAAFEPSNPVGGVYDNWTQRLRLIEAT